MMKIAFCCNGAAGVFNREERFGGKEIRALIFAQALAGLGHEVLFVLPDGERFDQQSWGDLTLITLPYGRDLSWFGRVTEAALRHVEPMGRFPFVRIRSWAWPLLWQLPLAGLHHAMTLSYFRQGYFPGLVRKIGQIDADMWCCFKPSMHTASAVEGACRADVPVVTMIANDVDLGEHVYNHSRQFGPKNTCGHAAWRSIAYADAVVVQTRWQQERLLSRFNCEGVMIRNPIDVDAGTTAPPPIDEPYVLWIGRGDTDHKRPRLAFQLATVMPDVRFVMVMNALDTKLQAQLIAEAPPNVHIVQFVPFDKIDAYFKHALALISTSAYEGFPNTFLQAGKYGIPIVSLAIDPDGMMKRYGCGVTCGGDINRMQQALTQLMGDEHERQRLGDAARRYVAQHHSLAERVGELEQLFKSLVDARRSGRVGTSAQRTPCENQP